MHDTKEAVQTTSKQSCLQSDKDIDDAIKQASRVIIVMPAKAAGSSLEAFMLQCVHEIFPVYPYPNPNPDLLRDEVERDVIETFLKGEPLEMPKLISSHIDENTLIKMMRQLPRSVLLIYVHREENSRLKSAIKMVYSRPKLRSNYCDISLNETRNTCITGEDKLISVIKSKDIEIRYGESEILTCDTYDALKNNAPNMLFMHYKQVDKLQLMLAKHHCPEVTSNGAIHANGADARKSVQTTMVRIGKDKDVDLEEWVEAKGDMLSYALGLREESNKCQSLTRDMEDNLFGCETEFVRWSPNI